jgi:DNA-binding CsgD family transcriptional regulator/PAS domain-containing protein
MPALTHRHAIKLLECVRQLHADADLSTFPQRAVAAVGQLVTADSITYNEVDVVGNRLARHLDPPDFLLEPWMVPTFEAHMHEHPLINYHRSTGDGKATRISDLVPRRVYRKLSLYKEFLQRVNVEYQMSIALPAERGIVIGVALNRAVADFSQRDRDLLNLLLPHLSQAYSGCRAAAELHRNLGRLDRALQNSGRGIILIDDRRRILHWNDLAARAMERLFPDAVCRPNSRLPPSLDRWVSSRLSELSNRQGPNPSSTSAVVRDEYVRLSVQLCPSIESGEHLLLLDQQPVALTGQDLRPLGLPGRQAEVLACIARGHSNQEAARLLGLSPRTVQKHLEHIFRKLGVESRSAAIVRALEVAVS